MSPDRAAGPNEADRGGDVDRGGEADRGGEVEPAAAEVERAGQQVARVRAARGIEIDELSSRTYIRASVLRRMEDNDFTACGGACYARGQLRILATALRMDETPLIAAFDQDVSASEEPSAEEHDPPPRRRSRRFHTRPATTSMSTGLLLLASLVVAALLLSMTAFLR